MINLYSLGGIKLHLHDQDIQQSYGYKMSGKSQDLLYSPTIAVVDTEFISRDRNIKLKSSVFETQYGTVDDLVMQLSSYIGKPTIALAYVLRHNKIPSKTLNGCACQCGKYEDCFALWLQCLVQLEAVIPSSNGDQADEISLSIDLIDYWRPIDPVAFKWRRASNQPLQISSPTFPYLDNCRPFPRCEQIFTWCNDCYDFGWTNPYYDEGELSYWFDPQFWSEYITCNCFGDCGSGCVKYAEASNFSGVNIWHDVDVNGKIFNAPPMSVYALRNLPNSGEVKIVVSRPDGMSFKKTTSILSLDALHQQMINNGYTLGLLTSDVVYVGDVKSYAYGDSFRPSLILREGKILSDVHPSWVYSDYFPGMLAPNGLNRFLIQADTQVQSAYLHLFRRM